MWHYAKTVALRLSRMLSESNELGPARVASTDDVDAWLDHELASLRQEAEGETKSRNARRHTEEAVAPKTQLVPAGHRRRRVVPRSWRKARRFVRARRLEIVFYGLCIAIASVAAWVISTMPKP